MPVKVIDASALAAVLFNEPDSESVVAGIARDSLVAPQLISFEIASVCLKKIRAHPRRRDMFLAAFQLIDRMDIDLVSVDLGDVVALAEDTGLTVYDACYLWLARLLRSELLTLDKKLAAAMAR
jgi:predicted nucleic acid-binding protein